VADHRFGASITAPSIVRTLDAHAGGSAVRLVVEGFPSPRGATMLARRDWLLRHADHLRRALLLEPRGHRDLCGAVLTEPVAAGSHAGVLFMHNAGYSAVSGHGLMAVTTIALAHALIVTDDPSAVVFDTMAGTIRARAHLESGVSRVTFVNVPSFVLQPGLPIMVGQRKLRADIAFGGVFYAIVDSEALGLAIDGDRLPELRRAGMEIRRAVDAVQTIEHPLLEGLGGIGGVILTAPPRDVASALRNVVVFGDGAAERSPGGTATAALMAVVDAMGLMDADVPFVHEGPIGTRFTGRIVARTTVGDYPAIVPEISGESWLTGEHRFWLAQDDPFRAGFVI
jgi:proline racemase